MPKERRNATKDAADGNADADLTSESLKNGALQRVAAERLSVERLAEKTANYPIRNLNFFMDANDHRMLRMHSIQTDKSLQSIMAEALNLYLAQHGLGPIRLVKAYRLNGGPNSRAE